MTREETPTEMMDDVAEYAERQVAPIYHGRQASENRGECDEQFC